MSYIQLKSMKKTRKKEKEDYLYRRTWSKACYKDENAAVYLSGPRKNPFLFSEKGREKTDKTEDYFYLFLCFLRHLDIKKW